MMTHPANKTTPKEKDFLEHYGKKGMKWGVRTGKKGASTISKASSVAKTKISALNTSRNRKVAAAGAAFVGGILKTAGRKALTSYARQEIMGQLVKARPPTGT